MLFQEFEQKYPPWVGLQCDYLMPISVPGMGISLPLIRQGAPGGTPEHRGIILSLLLVAHHNQMIRRYLLKTPPTSITGHREINLTD